MNSYCPNTAVIGEAYNVKSALDVINETNPDLLLLDIRMPSGLEGFEVVDKMVEKNVMVIFVTAFKDYALKAFQANALHYIMKPVDIDELSDAIGKARDFKTKSKATPNFYADYVRHLQDLKKQLQPKSNKISISHTKGIKLIEPENIIRLQAEGNCTKLFFKDGTSYLDTRTLKKYEELLDLNLFFRTHKSHIINLDYLSEYSNENGHFAILDNHSIIPISRNKIGEFIQTIKK